MANMKTRLLKNILLCIAGLIVFSINMIFGQRSAPALKHPDTSSEGWHELFNNSLSNAIFPTGVWSNNDGVITATKDEALWSNKEYDDFILDLEFKNADSTNSGIIVHASDMQDWIPQSVEIQIADDFSDKWKNVPGSWQCGAVFGHKAASVHNVKKPGEWNHFTITCIGKKIWVVLNDVLVNEFDMSLYTSAKTNPDGRGLRTPHLRGEVLHPDGKGHSGSRRKT